MYLGEPRRKKKRRSSPVRVLILLIMIGATLYFYGLIRQEEVESPFIPTPTPTRSAFSYADEALELYLQGKLPQAIDTYERAIALDPDDVLFYIPLVRLLTLEGRSLEAIRYGQQVVGMAPENARAWAVLGMAYDWDGRVTEAVDACQYAVELDPTYAEGYAYLAEAYADAMRWAEATEAAQTALQLDDHSVDVHRNYGYVLEVQGNWSGAIEAYEQALQIHPNLAHIHIAVGRNYRALGNFDAALRSFQRAADVAPDNAVANDQLGWTYSGLGEYEQAETYLMRATEADPQWGRAFGHLAINYWGRRNYEEAIPNFERAMKLEFAEARQRTHGFRVTVEDRNSAVPQPSADVVLSGDFAPTATDNRDVLRAALAPNEQGEGLANARGTVTLNTRTGEYTVVLEGMPPLSYDEVYAGWFEGLNTISGDPLGTGPLWVKTDGSVTAQLETAWIEAAPVEYFYTLGLAYFYMEECEKAYPLFEVALQIVPEEPNALAGIRLCQLSEE